MHPRGEGATGARVLLSSHILAEVEALCDRVSIIRAGRTVETGTLDELRHLTRTTVTAETRARRPTGSARCRASTTSTSTATGCGSTSTPTQLDDVLRTLADARRASRWSATRRRWRSCSCASTATSGAAHDRVTLAGTGNAGAAGAAPRTGATCGSRMRVLAVGGLVPPRRCTAYERLYPTQADLTRRR